MTDLRSLDDKRLLVEAYAKTLGLHLERMHVLVVDRHEYNMILSGLARMRMAVSSDIRRAKARGFVPADGKGDRNSARATTLARLCTRLGLHKREGVET